MRVSTSTVLAAAVGCVLAAAAPAAAQRTVVRPAGASAAGAASPGVRVGNTLYISAQPGSRGSGATPAPMDAQARQAMDGVGAVLKSAGLGFEHLVKCHVYLANMDDYAAMNTVYGSYFKDRVPARTTIQAAGLPGGAGVQIACIAFADLSKISVVKPPEGSLPAPLGPYSAAVWAGDTLYLSGMGGQDPKTKTVGESVEAQATQTLANITTTLKAAGLELFDVSWAQGYATRAAEAAALDAAIGRAVQTPRGLVVVPRLPGPIRAEITFVAVRSQAAANYVDATSAPGAGVEAQTKAVLAKLKLALGRAKSDWADVALLSVYVTDLADLPRVDAILAETFPKDPPARVTIQVQPQGAERVRIAMITAR